MDFTDITDLKERILKTEVEYPRYLARWQETEFGMLYWNENDKDNPTLNHALLYPDQIRDFKVILDSVTTFYLKKGIQPRVQQPYTSGYFMDHADEFRVNGYDVQLFAPTEFMLLTGENKIQSNRTLEIHELKEWDPRIERDILIPDGRGYAAGQVRGCIENDRYRVLVGYLNNNAVSMVTIFYGDYGLARLSSAETAEELRGRGYARELISAIVDMHRAESDLPVYLWPQNVTAARIFKEAGFEVIFQEELARAVYHRSAGEER